MGSESQQLPNTAPAIIERPVNFTLAGKLPSTYHMKNKANRCLSDLTASNGWLQALHLDHQWKRSPEECTAFAQPASTPPSLTAQNQGNADMHQSNLPLKHMLSQHLALRCLSQAATVDFLSLGSCVQHKWQRWRD